MVRDYSNIDRPQGLDPLRLGRAPFLLRPGHFAIVDGDTIWALPQISGRTPPRGNGPNNSWSMRFRSIAAPEKPKTRMTDGILKAAGINPHWDSAGQKSTDLLKTYLGGRALLVEPTGKVDRYGRMLCDMAVVPYVDGQPNIRTAVSLERLMLRQKVVDPFENELAPPVHPQVSLSSGLEM